MTTWMKWAEWMFFTDHAIKWNKHTCQFRQWNDRTLDQYSRLYANNYSRFSIGNAWDRTIDLALHRL